MSLMSDISFGCALIVFYFLHLQPPPVPGMEEQPPSYNPQPPAPAIPKPPQSPTTSEKPPPPPPPTIPPPPNSHYPPPPSPNAYNSNNPMTYPPGDPNQVPVYNHSQGRPGYGQGFQGQNTYLPPQNNSQQQGQYGPGLGRGEANKPKNQKQGQQLWHRMKRNVFFLTHTGAFSRLTCSIPRHWTIFHFFFFSHRGTWDSVCEVQYPQKASSGSVFSSFQSGLFFR